MLYKVTPMMEAEPEKKQRDPGAPRKRRATAIYDRDGSEVLISLMCLKCRKVKPLAQFGLRKMADGAIRNQPWCRPCRSGAGTHKPKAIEGEGALAAPIALHAAAPFDTAIVQADIEVLQMAPLVAMESSTEATVESVSAETALVEVEIEPEAAAPGTQSAPTEPLDSQPV